MKTLRYSLVAAAAFVVLAIARPVDAATIYSNLQDIAIPTNFTGIYLNIDTGATSTSTFTGWDINPFFGGVGIGNSAAFQPVRVGSSNLDAVLKLNIGSVISASLTSGTFSTGIGGSGNSGHEHIGAGADQFQVGTEGYLGFKFTKDDSSGPYYGWMRLVLTNNASGALIKDWGYDNVSGSPIVAGRVQQSAVSGSAQLVTLSPGTGESFSLGSAITNTGGNINSVLKTGSGTTTLAVANTFTGATTVTSGTLVASGTGALGSTSGITINTGGTLLLGGSGNRISDTAAVTLSGGTFNSGGLSETVGALTLSGSSVIDLSGAGVVHFASSSSQTWSGTLSIWDWAGNVTGGGTNQLFFGADTSGLTSAQLAGISFYSGAGTGYLGSGKLLFGGELVPIPEPATILGAVALLGFIGCRERRRCMALVRAGVRRKRGCNETPNAPRRSLVMKHLFVVAIACLSFALQVRAQAPNSSWVYPSASGNLLYQLDERGQGISDFSNCGYLSGTAPLPNVSVVIPQNRWVYVTAGAGDQTATIQAAIDTVSAMSQDANGWRGVVYLNAGLYKLGSSVNITASGVVLKGAGNNFTTGTRLEATGTTQYIPIIASGPNSRSTVANTTHNFTQTLVPAGARSFQVDSTSGLAVGDTVQVYRPSTANWIVDINMDLLGPGSGGTVDDVPWTAGTKDLKFDRIITRIDGSWITVDIPLPQTFEALYGGGQIWKYTWSGRIQQVGIEDIYGFSDYDPGVTDVLSGTTYHSDENHAWSFISMGNMLNGWVRNITAQYFGYSAVLLNGGGKWITVADSQCLDAVSIITGERRYSFNNQGTEMALFINNYAREGRHDFVYGSLVPGPNAFVFCTTGTAYEETGPHHRWSVGGLFDNISVRDDLSVQNRGNYGTGHGWAGAYYAVWNSWANFAPASHGFRVRNPPTARNWLIGSIGPLLPSSAPVGADPAGTYDLSGTNGTNVYPQSLYYGQLQQRLKWPGSEFREAWLGDVDQFASTSGTGGTVNCDATWLSQVQALGTADAKFDYLVGSRYTAFTFDLNLDAGDTVVAASLTVSLRAIGSASSTDNLLLDGTAASNTQTFTSIGWSPVATTGTNVRTVEVSPSLLTDGRLNVALGTKCVVDYAVLHYQVQKAQAVSYAVTLTPEADAYVRGGTNAALNFGSDPTLQTKDITASNNNREAFIRWNLSGVTGKLVSAKVRLGGVASSQAGNQSCATFVSDDTWGETTLTFNNKPASGKLFAQWLPVTGQAVEFDVTSQVADTLLETTPKLSLRILSTGDYGGSGNVTYASRENATAANRPQLILTFVTPVPTISDVADQTVLVNTTTGALPFTVSDSVLPASSLTVTGSSSNNALVPVSNIVFSGTDTNRTVTVTPAANQTGSSTITLTVSNGTLTASDTLTLTVLPPAPSITSSLSAARINGLAFSYQITATNSPTSFGASPLPTGLSVNTSTGLISGTPTQTGSFSTTVSATNASGTGSATLVLTDGVQNITTPGTSAWTAPANVTSVQVECWGGGGAGGSAVRGVLNMKTATGGGGAGGAYAKLNSYPVTPGATYYINVGAGGVSSTADDAVVSGSDSWFNSVNSPSSVILAKGGAGGQSTVTGTTDKFGTGGTGTATGSIGDVVNKGGSGAPSTTGSFGGGGGGSGGSGNVSGGNIGNSAIVDSGTGAPVVASGVGGNGGDANPSGSSGSGKTPTIPPGGGGGGARASGTTQRIGGTGTSGQVILTVLATPPSITSSLSTTGTVGTAFNYQITASNSPISYNATGMPAGLSVNTSTGLISGTASASGTSGVTISGSNSWGTGSATLTITVLTSVESWRQLYFGTISNTGNAADSANPDGDAFTNLQEYILGTNPTTPDTGGLLTITPGSGSITLSFVARQATGSGYAGLTRHYAVESTTDLTNSSSWVALIGYSDIVGASQTVNIPQTISGTKRFYRLKAWLQ